MIAKVQPRWVQSGDGQRTLYRGMAVFVYEESIAIDERAWFVTMQRESGRGNRPFVRARLPGRLSQAAAKRIALAIVDEVRA